MTDLVNHPPHYVTLPVTCPGCGGRIECIDVAEQLGFNLGNAVKYIWRSGFKGREVEDLEKSVWYLTREIARARKGTADGPTAQ